MSTVKAWLIANAEIIYVILQIILSLILWWIFPETTNEDGAPLALTLGLGFLGFTAFFLWTVKSWKGAIGVIVAILILGGVMIFNKEVGADIPTLLKIWGIVLMVISIICGLVLSIAAYRNFDEVVSRRFLYRNSSVSVFEEQTKYAISRFYVGFISVLSFGIEIIVAIEVFTE